MNRIGLALMAAVAMSVAVVSPAFACGGLVAPNGAVRLANTTTLAAWHDGLERYVTSFEFQSDGSAFGDIVPLPAVPLKIEKAGAWTLQRLEREVPRPQALAATSAGAAVGQPAQVIQQVHIDALQLTVLSGGGQAVTDWVRQNGFLVSTDLPAMLDWYAKTSRVFLVAHFDPAQARARGQVDGDGTPIQITMAVPQPWVPLRILTLAKPTTEFVTADVFLLTDGEPLVYGPANGVQVQLNQPASTQLLNDLRSDRASMSWIPSRMWLTYVSVAGQAQTLDNDLVVQGAAGPPVQRRLAPPPTTSAPSTTTTSTTILPLKNGPIRLLSGPLSAGAGANPARAVIAAFAGALAGVMLVVVAGALRARRRTGSDAAG